MRTESGIAGDEELLMHIRRRRSSYTKPDTFQLVPRNEVQNRSKVPFGLSPPVRGSGSDKLRHERVTGFDKGIELRGSLQFVQQIHDRTLIERKRFGTMVIPPFEIFADRRSVFLRRIRTQHVSKGILRQLFRHVKMRIYLRLPRKQILLTANNIELTEGIGSIRRP